MILSLKGKRALVCGASQGIGRATAMIFAEAGADLILVARNEEKLATLKKEIESKYKTQIELLPLDLSDLTQTELKIKPLTKNLTQKPIHILLNNTGGPPAGPILEASPDDFLKPFRQHIMASHLLVKLLVPAMIEAQYGRIVNVISTSVKEPIAGLGVSNTIRGAMASWSKTLSQELPPHITINNVLPGYTDTSRLTELKKTMAGKRNTTEDTVVKDWLSQIPEKRLGHPDETAAAILFLCSPQAAYIRGVSLPVDGGRLRSI